MECLSNIRCMDMKLWFSEVQIEYLELENRLSGESLYEKDELDEEAIGKIKWMKTF